MATGKAEELIIKDVAPEDRILDTSKVKFINPEIKGRPLIEIVGLTKDEADQMATIMTVVLKEMREEEKTKGTPFSEACYAERVISKFSAKQVVLFAGIGIQQAYRHVAKNQVMRLLEGLADALK